MPYCSSEGVRGTVLKRGAEAPARFYRLSASCQPTLEKLVAGARNQRYLQLWSGAA